MLMKRSLCVGLLIILMILPSLGLTEGDDTIQLAKTIYTLGRDESYETKLMIGSVVMNRTESPWFPDTIKEVLNQPHQFPQGTLYDEESLSAAREIMLGRKTLPNHITGYAALDGAVPESSSKWYTTSGNYGFFCEK